MSDPSKMSGQPILPDTISTTSSQASADGRLHCDLPVGPTPDLFGLGPLPASRSARQARARRAMTDATCGLRGWLSSASAALQSSLESRLRRQLDGAGSTLFSLIWKRRATPAGRPYFQLVASARRTSGTAFGSWPTPDTMMGPHGARGVSSNPKHQSAQGLEAIALRASWPTTTAKDADSTVRSKAKDVTLTEAARRASWGTPAARDVKGANMKSRLERHGKADDQLANQVVHLTSGAMPNGSPAATARRGQLNPDHSRWLMGYAAAHICCAPTATQLSRSSRRNSSARSVEVCNGG